MLFLLVLSHLCSDSQAAVQHLNNSALQILLLEYFIKHNVLNRILVPCHSDVAGNETAEQLDNRQSNRK